MLALLLLVELLAGGIGQAQLVARELHDRDLHAQADTKVGLLPLPREAGGPRLALDASVAEATGHEDAVRGLEPGLGLLRALLRRNVLATLQVGGIDPIDLQLPLHGHRGVVQRRHHGLVRIGAALVVLADERDDHLRRSVGGVNLHGEVVPVDECAQGGVGRHARGRLRAGDVQAVQREHAIKQTHDVLFGQDLRNMEQVLDIVGAQDPRRRNVALVRDLLLRAVMEGLGTAADDQVRLHAGGQQGLDGVLCRLCLLPAHVRDVRAMAPCQRVVRQTELELPERLDERHGLDVADGAAELDHANLGAQSATVDRHACRAVQPLNDRTCHVRDDLYCLPQIVAPALLLDDRIIDLASGHVVLPQQGQEHHALVVPQIQICLASIIKHEDLSVLVGAHQARIDVEIRIQLDGGNAEAVPS
mmetsp:Transcript_144811/g.464141  ORF Transcript_144811/g.464141 Transcript_144811/m.464141 type:complete len:419 (+) Transcript_144811:743-1999(+)